MSLIQDLRFALRLIAKERWFSAVAVLALTLGIGVNATVFTLVNAVLVRGLPFKDSHNLYMMGPLRPPSTQAQNLSYPDLLEWRAQSRTFESIAGFTRGSMNLADDTNLPVQARGTWLTANAFRTLGQQPLLGRDFAPEDDRVGAERVVILGYSLWQNRYGGQENVLGRPLRVNGQPATIVGVMPEGMMFPTDSELWMAFVPNNDQLTRKPRPLAIFGRLRSDTTRAQGHVEMNGIAARLATQYPDTNKELAGAIVQTFNERFNGGDIRQVFLAMMGAVGFVLLIACANVANLLLSRAAHRSREVAVRMALGASRWRVVRQLLIESIVLGFMGGALGILLAMVGTRLFDAAVADSGKPYWIQFTIDWVVLGYVAAICVVTGVLFGLAPALQVSRTNVNEIMKEGGRGTAGNRRAGWMSGVMVVVELTLTIVLLVGAGGMIRSFMKLYAQDYGFKTENLMTMQLQLPELKYPTADVRRVFFDRLTPKLASLPGVESVTLATAIPPAGGGRRTFEIEGRPLAERPQDRPALTDVTIGPNFFETLGVPVLRGRAFTETDGSPGNEAVIVNERFIAEFFPGEDPLGKRIRFPEQEKTTVWRTIVGVSAHLRYGSPQDSEPRSVAYLPLRQQANSGATLIIKSRLEPGVIMSSVRREVQSIDPDQPVFRVQTVDESLARQRWPIRVFGTIFAILALIALLMSSVGLYAVMAYSVTQRTQEIGVRMALGAEGKQVRWLILRRGLIQLAIGLAIGLTGAWYASQVLPAQLLVQVAPNDPMTLAGIAALLSAVSIAACMIPAARATRLDPLTALRVE